MKHIALKSAVVGLCFGALACASLALDAGDSLEQTLSELGKPHGSIHIGETTIYYYDRGRVEIHEGQVISADLISKEVFAAQRIEQERVRQIREEELRDLKARRFEEGMAVLARKLSDPQFLDSPASRRLAYWRAFQRTYPEVTLPEDYVVALEERDAELRLSRAESRVRQLEQRVADAERRVDDARQRESVSYASYAVPYYASYPSVVVAGGSYWYSKSARNGCGDRPHREGDYVEHYGDDARFASQARRTTREYTTGQGNTTRTSRGVYLDSRGNQAYDTKTVSRVTTGGGSGNTVTRSRSGFVRGPATHFNTIHSRPFYRSGSTVIAGSTSFGRGITHVTAGH